MFTIADQMTTELADIAFEQKLNRLFWAIEQANTEPVELEEYLTGDEILEKMDEDLGEDLLSNVLVEAIEKTLAEVDPTPRMPKLEASPLEWVRAHLVGVNAWQLFDEVYGRLKHTAGGGRAIALLLKDAAVVDQANEEFKAMVNTIVNDCDRELAAYKENPKTARKPAELYRAYADALRFARSQGFPMSDTLRDLEMAQSLPFGELDHPDWIDSYTGEVDLDAARPMAVRKTNAVPVPEQNHLKKVLGWDDDTIDDFTRAQEGFNADWDEEEEFLDETDVRDPQFMVMQRDLQPTEDLRDLKRRLPIRNLENKLLELGKLETEKAQDQFRASEEAAKFMTRLQREMLMGCPVTDAATLFLSFQHDRGFKEEDAYNLFLEQRLDNQGIRNLGEWLEIFGEEFLEQFSMIGDESRLVFDPAPVHRAATPEQIEEFVEQTIQLYADQGNPMAADITQTPAYLEGYYRAMFSAQEISSHDSQGYHNLAVEAGWEAWRKWKSLEGNLAYHAAKKAGADNKAAMRVFWGIVNGSGAGTKRKDVVTAICGDGTGLTLSSGRKITWRIARMKLDAGEFELSGEKQAKLESLLVAHHV